MAIIAVAARSEFVDADENRALYIGRERRSPMMKIRAAHQVLPGLVFALSACSPTASNEIESLSAPVLISGSYTHGFGGPSGWTNGDELFLSATDSNHNINVFRFNFITGTSQQTVLANQAVAGATLCRFAGQLFLYYFDASSNGFAGLKLNTANGAWDPVSIFSDLAPFGSTDEPVCVPDFFGKMLVFFNNFGVIRQVETSDGADFFLDDDLPSITAAFAPAAALNAGRLSLSWLRSERDRVGSMVWEGGGWSAITLNDRPMVPSVVGDLDIPGSFVMAGRSLSPLPGGQPLDAIYIATSSDGVNYSVVGPPNSEESFSHFRPGIYNSTPRQAQVAWIGSGNHLEVSGFDF